MMKLNGKLHLTTKQNNLINLFQLLQSRKSRSNKYRLGSTHVRLIHLGPVGFTYYLNLTAVNRINYLYSDNLDGFLRQVLKWTKQTTLEKVFQKTIS